MGQAKIVIFGSGGTIAGRADSPSQGVGYRAGELSIERLLDAVPDLQQMAGYSLEARQLAQVDSKDMDTPLWLTLVHACEQALADPEVHALVITHGTDTIEETAWLLHCLLQPCKPVVLTCAMRPATALLADGPQNLRDAVAVAAHGHRPGVWVVAGGEVHCAVSVQKVHPYRLNAFAGGDAGPQALVQEGQVRWLVAPAPQPAQALAPAGWPAELAAWPVQRAVLATTEWPWVEILTSTAAANARCVPALVGAGVRGLVVAGTGNATVHQSLEAALVQARQQGVWVWRSTRCLEGTVVQAAPGVAQQAGGEPALAAVALSPVKARICMMLALASAASTASAKAA